MDGTHLNTSQLVCSLLGKVYLGTNLDFRLDHSQDVQLQALPPPFYALLVFMIDLGLYACDMYILHVHVHVHVCLCIVCELYMYRYMHRMPIIGASIVTVSGV